MLPGAGSWAVRTHRLAIAIEQLVDAVLRRLRRPTTAVTIVSYLGHGSHHEVAVRGRVLAGEPVPAATGLESALRRFRRMAARFATRELANVTLNIEVGADQHPVTTDDEGYFIAQWSTSELAPGRHDLSIDVVAGLDTDAVAHHQSNDAAVLVPSTTATHLVISDIDDTVLQTGVGRAARVVLRTMTSSAWSRRPVADSPALLRALRDGADGTADNPCFYVSSSPWNLYDFLRAFLDHNDFPVGPLWLSDYGINEEFIVRRDHQAHKLEAIAEILDLHPTLPVVLVGDTTEADPTIYRHVIAERHGRVAAVLLHDDGANPTNAERAIAAFSSLDVPVAVGSARSLLATAAAHGLIAADARAI